MRLIRLLFSLLLLVVVAWFATTVQLGRLTLYGHLRAIFATQEAKDLADGAKEEAKKIADRLRQENIHPDAGTSRAAAKPPLDPVGVQDRRALDELVHDKAHPPSNQKTHQKPTQRPGR